MLIKYSCKYWYVIIALAIGLFLVPSNSFAQTESSKEKTSEERLKEAKRKLKER